jgi:hypothetical protein
MTSATGLRRLAAATAILLLTTAMHMMSLFAADAASASTVTPVQVDGNPTCASFDAEGTMLKIEGAGGLSAGDSGRYSVAGLSVSVDIYATDAGWAFDWTSDVPIDVVVAKGGPTANVYTYGGSMGDTGLHAPLNPSSDLWYGLSHISLCTGDATSTTETTTVTTAPTTDTTPTTPTTRTTPTVPKTTPELGAIGDYVWLDLDGDGSQGPPTEEKPVAGATVQLLSSDGTVLASQTTGVDGLYLFDDLEAGNYRVQVVVQGATYTIPRAPGISAAANSDVDPLGNGVGRTAVIALSAGEVDLTWDAGIVVEVLGVQIEATTTTTVEPVTLDTLPFTGPRQAGILAAAFMVALAGVVTLLIAGLRPTRKTHQPLTGTWSNY